MNLIARIKMAASVRGAEFWTHACFWCAGVFPLTAIRLAARFVQRRRDCLKNEDAETERATFRFVQQTAEAARR